MNGLPLPKSSEDFPDNPEYECPKSEKDVVIALPYCLYKESFSPLIKDFVTAMSAIRKRIFTSLKNEHTENYEINQLLAYEQPSAYIVANDEYSADTTLTPVLTANKGFVLGYTDEDFGIYQKGVCIIFDDFKSKIFSNKDTYCKT